MSFFTGFLAFIRSLKNIKYKYFSAFAAIIALFFIVGLSDNAYAKLFVIQNESVNMLVVNGSSGNIILNPNAGFGNVGVRE